MGGSQTPCLGRIPKASHGTTDAKNIWTNMGVFLAGPCGLVQDTIRIEVWDWQPLLTLFYRSTNDLDHHHPLKEPGWSKFVQ